MTHKNQAPRKKRTPKQSRKPRATVEIATPGFDLPLITIIPINSLAAGNVEVKVDMGTFSGTFLLGDVPLALRFAEDEGR